MPPRVRDGVASMGRVAWMGVMDRSILFTSHAEENLRLREIMREEVERVIRDPRRVEAGRSGRKTLSGVYSDSVLGCAMVLRVVVEESAESITVITMYKTSKFNKYLPEGVR